MLAGALLIRPWGFPLLDRVRADGVLNRLISGHLGCSHRRRGSEKAIGGQLILLHQAGSGFVRHGPPPLLNPGEPGTFNSVLLPVAVQLLPYVDLNALVLVVVIPRRNA